MRRLLPIAFAACLASGLVACRQAPPPGASGKTIYTLQNCANCHGGDERGTARGPALFGLNAYWERTAMAQFFADPKGLASRDSRLSAMIEAYPAEMSTYENLTLSERLVLADYLLEGR